jgi:hypothetical protein
MAKPPRDAFGHFNDRECVPSTATGTPRRRAHGPGGTSFWEDGVASEQRAVPLEDLDLHRYAVNHCSGPGFAKSAS